MSPHIYHRKRFQKINYCSAPPGSGKTHHIGNESRNLAEGFNKVLIIGPTRDLAEKTAAEEIHPFQCRIFHKDRVEGSVAKALSDYVAEVPDDVQEVVLATHQVLPHIRDFANKDKWHVLIDEELQVVRYDKYEIPQTHDLITKYLAVRSVNSVYGRVELIDRDAVEEIARNEDDDEILETLAGGRIPPRKCFPVARSKIGISDDGPKRCGRCRKHKSNRERVAQQQRQRAREEKLRLLAAQ